MSTKVRNAIVSTPFQVLLLGILAWGALNYNGLRLSTAGGGLVLFFLASYLLAMSGLRQLGRYFISLAYLALLLGLLNYLAVLAAAAPFGPLNSAVAAMLGFLYFLLHAALVFLPSSAKDQFPLSADERNLVYRAGIATVTGLMVGGMAVGLIFPAYSQRWFDVGFPPTWNAYYFSLLFAAVFSGTESILLILPPRVLRGSAVTLRPLETTLFVTVLLLICFAEWRLRQNWLLLSFSSIACTGTAFAFFLVWHGRADSRGGVLEHGHPGDRESEQI